MRSWSPSKRFSMRGRLFSFDAAFAANAFTAKLLRVVRLRVKYEKYSRRIACPYCWCTTDDLDVWSQPLSMKHVLIIPWKEDGFKLQKAFSYTVKTKPLPVLPDMKERLAILTNAQYRDPSLRAIIDNFRARGGTERHKLINQVLYRNKKVWEIYLPRELVPYVLYHYHNSIYGLHLAAEKKCIKLFLLPLFPFCA